ncbi:MAG TPA: AraC family transcriptional regulator [Chthoniobacter sp.]|nr:AraC family transcriptional regulator [Chthoniobacter sp.]
MLWPDNPSPPSSGQKPVEQAVWEGVDGVWRPLDGSFFGGGVSIEWHDFRLDADMDWARSFHPGCLEICLNFSGSGALQDGASEQPIEAGQVAIYTTHPGRPKARRAAGSWHRFLTLEMGREFLRTHFDTTRDRLKESVCRFMDSTGEPPAWLEIMPLPPSLLGTRRELLQPPVPEAARPMWYRAKVLEILAQTLFLADSSSELFCHRHLRQNRERVDRVCYLIERDLENPPSLDMLAQEVGCSPFHLSRVFAEQAGMSIPKYLRTKRIERAAEMLQTGKGNVTQAAMSVGYSSLSAFNKAFVEQMGCCPGLYPVVKIQGRKTRGAKA